MRALPLLLVFFTLAVVSTLFAEAPQPTLANVSYGQHAAQTLDFYRAASEKPTPVLFVIHGGGWMYGDKSGYNNGAPFLSAGISVISINYRFLGQAEADGLVPPVKGPLLDAARALQFVRSKAAEWNIDKGRIIATGSSAGACSALWLAFHPDLAEPASSDPVARESTRLSGVAVTKAQTTLDPAQMQEWISNGNYGSAAFGFKAFDEFLQQRESIAPWLAEYSPYALVSADDPPVYLSHLTPPALGEEVKDPAHSANYGVKLQERCRAAGVPCELVYPGAPNVKHPTLDAYLLEKLKQ